MNIHLPIALKAVGGTSSFARKFAAAAAAQGHQVNFSLTPVASADLLLVIVSCPLPLLFHAKRRRLPVVHRLDGTYYPATISGYAYPLYNFKAKLIHRHAADLTIYQSRYSKKTCERFLGRPHSARQLFIYNGVDVERFTPVGEAAPARRSGSQPVFITASRFRRRDQIVPLLQAFTLYRQQFNPQSILYVIGSFEGEVRELPDQYQLSENVNFLGQISNSELPKYLRAADVFLFTHQNPPCPNNIIEAMACGLPICGVADGAMPELTRPGINSELVPAPGDGYYSFRQLNLDGFAANLNKIMSDRVRYSRAARAAVLARFTLNQMTRLYLDALANLIAP